MTNVVYEGAECATCGTSETCGLLTVQIYIRRYKLIVAVHYGSYLSADKYLYKVVDWPSDLHVFIF